LSANGNVGLTAAVRVGRVRRSGQDAPQRLARVGAFEAKALELAEDDESEAGEKATVSSMPARPGTGYSDQCSGSAGQPEFPWFPHTAFAGRMRRWQWTRPRRVIWSQRLASI